MLRPPVNGWVVPAMASAAGAKTGTGWLPDQFGDAADVVAVVMGDQDGA